MLLSGMSSRFTGAEETEGAILRAIVLVGVVITRRLSLVKLLVILEGPRLNFANVKAFSNNIIER
jgi:hypothetical protein